jgi:predicted RNase H-like HicB family nuclease
MEKERQRQLLRETRVDFFKSPGPGGQHKNKAETAVRLVHKPTGITIIARRRRSRARNLKLALERLALRLEAAAYRPPRRIPTSPSAAARQRMLELKRRRGMIKKMRGKALEWKVCYHSFAWKILRRIFMRQFKIIVEKHPDGYVAYPLGLKGVVVGQGDTYEEALSDVKSAIRFHIETFGQSVLDVEPPILEAFVAETGIKVWWQSFPLMHLNKE